MKHIDIRKGSIVFVRGLGNCFVVVALNEVTAICQHVDSPIWAEIPLAVITEVMLY